MGVADSMAKLQEHGASCDPCKAVLELGGELGSTIRADKMCVAGRSILVGFLRDFGKSKFIRSSMDVAR